MNIPLQLPFVIGHRGAAGLAPENTLAGIERAAALGVAWVEVDVRLTAAGVCVLIHDETLDRTTNGRGEVAQLDESRRAGLDAGSWFGDAWRGQAVPDLEQCLALADRLGLGLNIEIKPAPRCTAETVEAVVEAVRGGWPSSSPPPLVSSLDREVLRLLARRAPDLPRAIVLEELRLEGLDELALASVHVWEVHLDEQVVERVRTASPHTRLAAFTVNSRRRAAQLAAWGVDAVFSDYPDRLGPQPAR